jgi:hypothetical protein
MTRRYRWVLAGTVAVVLLGAGVAVWASGDPSCQPTRCGVNAPGPTETETETETGTGFASIDPTTTVTESPNPSTPTTATSTVAQPPPPGPNVVPAPTRAQLQAALVTPADLPGFHVMADVPPPDRGGCPPLDTGMDHGAGLTVETLLGKSAVGPIVRERITVYSGQSAAAAVAIVRGAPSSCPSFVIVDPTLGRLDYSIAPLAFPRYGDESAAVRVTAISESYRVAAFENLVAVRRGSVLMLITHTDSSINGIDDSLTMAVVGSAYTKLAHVL